MCWSVVLSGNWVMICFYSLNYRNKQTISLQEKLRSPWGLPPLTYRDSSTTPDVDHLMISKLLSSGSMCKNFFPYTCMEWLVEELGHPENSKNCQGLTLLEYRQNTSQSMKQMLRFNFWSVFLAYSFCLSDCFMSICELVNPRLGWYSIQWNISSWVFMAFSMSHICISPLCLEHRILPGKNLALLFWT